MDGNSPKSRYYTHHDGSIELDAPMNSHDILLDFNLTGREFQEITDANEALLEIEGDRNYGNYFVYPADHTKQAVLRGARVFAVMEFDRSQKVNGNSY